MGRLAGLALAAAGAAGLERALEILEDEVKICLGLLGVDCLHELGPAYLYRGAPPVAAPHVTSAFPLLAEGY